MAWGCAAEFHQVIAAARVGLARDVGGDIFRQRTVAEFVNVFHREFAI